MKKIFLTAMAGLVCASLALTGCGGKQTASGDRFGRGWEHLLCPLLPWRRGSAGLVYPGGLAEEAELGEAHQCGGTPHRPEGL